MVEIGFIIYKNQKISLFPRSISISSSCIQYPVLYGYPHTIATPAASAPSPQPTTWGSSSHSPARGKHDSNRQHNPRASLVFLFSLWDMTGWRGMNAQRKQKCGDPFETPTTPGSSDGIGVFLRLPLLRGERKYHPTWSLVGTLVKRITVANGYRSIHTLTSNKGKQSAWNLGQYWPGYLQYQKAAMFAQELSDTATFFAFHLSLVVTRAFRAETGKISNCGKQWENKRRRAHPTHNQDSDMGSK